MHRLLPIMIVAACAIVVAGHSPISCSAQELAQESETRGLFDALFDLIPDQSPDENTSEAFSQDEPVDDSSAAEAADTDAAPLRGKGKRLEPVKDFDEAVKLARLYQRPVLVVLGAEWCVWCRKLEQELQNTAADPILQRWVVAEIDVDDHPDVAQQLQASALPALRVLGVENTVVAGREGYLSVTDLQAWLDEKMSAADPAIQSVLYQTGSPTEEELPQLVELLGHRSTSIRAAAVQRLVTSRRQSASAVVDVLRTGRLSQQLCAVEILEAWQAPLTGIDPWQPNASGGAITEALLEWLRSEAEQIETELPTARPRMVDEDASLLVTALLTSSAAEQSTVVMEAIQAGDALAPALRQRLGDAGLSDSHRVLLREILYQVLSGQQTRLKNARLLVTLAGFDEEARRQAAGELLAHATPNDQPLVDELSADPDAFIRELSVASLQQIGALQQGDRLLRLLSDKSPSVRTAALRELAEYPTDGSIQILIDYVDGESDEDLLVYATKALGQLGTKSGADAALAKLAENGSWRVRAAALDAILESLQGHSVFYSSRSDNVSETVASAVMRAVDDPEPLVAEKATKAIPMLFDQKTAEPIANFFVQHPEQISRIFTSFSDVTFDDSPVEPILKLAEQWAAEGDDVQRVRTGAAILAHAAPKQLEKHLLRLMQSDDAETRIAAMIGTIEILRAFRDNQDHWMKGHVSRDDQPWHLVPEELNFGSRKRAQGEQAAKSSESISPASVEPVDVDAESDETMVLFDFFGESSRPAPSRPVESTEASSVATDLDALSDLFGSQPVRPADQPQLLESMPDGDTQDHAINDSNIIRDGMRPSEWLDAWQTDITASRELPWMEEIQATLLAQEMGEDVTRETKDRERQWRTATLLASGKMEFAPQVVEFLLDDRGTADATDPLPREQQILPWLPAELRRNFITGQQFDWHNMHTESQQTFWNAATVIDDRELAEWLYGQWHAIELNDMDVPHATKVLLQALLGNKVGDTLSPWVSKTGRRYEQDALATGTDSTIAWLREHYQSAESYSQRAVLLQCYSYLDPERANQTAIGLVAAAERFDLTVQLATIMSLTLDEAEGRFLAGRWLGHPLQEVRHLALQRLLTAHPQFARQHLVRGVRFSADSNEALPGFWALDEPISAEVLKRGRDAESHEKLQRKWMILQLAAGENVSLDSFEKADEFERVLVVGALAKTRRADDEAVKYYERSIELLTTEETAETCYKFLRSVADSRVAELRRAMRAQWGSAALQ